MKLRFFVLLLAAAAALTLRADEIHLKDGSKIIGSIVGFENGSFKVETAYGFAMIRKDAVADIVPTDPRKTALPPSAPNLAEESPAVPKPAAASPPTHQIPVAPKPASISQNVSKTVSQTASQRIPTVDGGIPVLSAPRQPSGISPAKPVSLPADSPASSVAASPVIPPVRHTISAAPPRIQEFVRGNLYTNQTYGFEMYKPPDWDLIQDAGKALPNAIAALGTRDENSLIVVGHDGLGDSLDAHADATEHTLREIYQNYRSVSLKRTILAGCPAIEHRFRGDLDEHNWSVVTVTLARGKEAFTILGMTYADSDLIQLQDNVIAKTIASLQFTAAR